MITTGILTIVAGFAAFLTFVITRQVLRECRIFQNPTLIALIAAMLGFLGLLVMGDVIIYLILLPFAALALTILLLFLIGLFSRGNADAGDPKHPSLWEDLQKRWGRKTSNSSAKKHETKT